MLPACKRRCQLRPDEDPAQESTGVLSKAGRWPCLIPSSLLTYLTRRPAAQPPTSDNGQAGAEKIWSASGWRALERGRKRRAEIGAPPKIVQPGSVVSPLHTAAIISTTYKTIKIIGTRRSSPASDLYTPCLPPSTSCHSERNTAAGKCSSS